jgi:predicted transcriptional regulator
MAKKSNKKKCGKKFGWHYEKIVVLHKIRTNMEKLTFQEEELMMVIWQIGEGHIKAFMDKMQNPGPYTTIASTIRKIENKGYVKKKLFGNVHVYKPAISREEYKKKFMGNVVKNYFGNSYKELVNFFIDHKKLSPKELKEIMKMIEEGK